MYLAFNRPFSSLMSKCVLKVTDVTNIVVTSFLYWTTSSIIRVIIIIATQQQVSVNWWQTSSMLPPLCTLSPGFQNQNGNSRVFHIYPVNVKWYKLFWCRDSLCHYWGGWDKYVDLLLSCVSCFWGIWHNYKTLLLNIFLWVSHQQSFAMWNWWVIWLFGT